MTENKREPAQVGVALTARQAIDSTVPVYQDPEDGLEPLPVLGIEEIIDNLNRHSSPQAWMTVCRIQYVRDKRARDLEWWLRRVWVPNGCPLGIGQLRQASHLERWDRQRGQIWDRVAEYVFDQLIDQQAEEALTAHRKYRAVEALMLAKLIPIVTEDGELQFQSDVRPKSYEGMVRALVDLKRLQMDSTEHMMELIAGGRPAPGQPEASGDDASQARRRLFDLGRIREIADELALQDGKSDSE